MQFTRTSPLTGEENTMDLPVSQEQLTQWQRGVPIQTAMPHLSPDEREFIISGMTSDDWKRMFG